MAQVQVNFRASSATLDRVERQRGRMARNAWLLEAVEEKLVRDGGVSSGRVVVTAPSRPVSVRAPRGCRMVGVSAAARELAAEVPVVVPGQLEIAS